MWTRSKDYFWMTLNIYTEEFLKGVASITHESIFECTGRPMSAENIQTTGDVVTWKSSYGFLLLVSNVYEPFSNEIRYILDLMWKCQLLVVYAFLRVYI